MRKLYTMLASVAVAATAVAAPQLPNGTFHLTSEGQKVLTERAHQFSVNPDLIPANDVLATRSYTTANGIFTLRMVIDRENPWVTMLGFKDESGNDAQMKFEDFPFYNVTMLVTGYNINTGIMETYLPVYMMWPSQYWYNQVWSVAGDEEIPEDERDYSAVSLEELSTNKEYCGSFKELLYTADGGINVNPYMTNDGVTAWLLFPPSMVPDGSFIYRNSNAETYQDGNTVMQFDFKNYLPETSEFSAMLKYPISYTTSSGGSRKTNFSLDYSGTIRDDMAPHTVNIDMFDVHIFNTGEASSNILGALKDPYSEPWGPLQRFWFMASANENVIVSIPEDMTKIESANLGFVFKEDTPAEDQINPDSQSYMMGALYSATGTEKPYGKWTVQTPTAEYYKDYEMVMLTMVPKAGTAIPGYDPVCQDEDGKYLEVPAQSYPEFDGFLIYLNGMTELPYQGTVIGCGSDKGLEIVGPDLFGNTINAQYVNNIYYHSDPTNVKVVEQIPAVSDATQGVDNIVAGNDNIRVINGEVVVKAAANTVVTIFTLDGAKVVEEAVNAGDVRSFSLDNGLYIVKAGNDVVKVML